MKKKCNNKKEEDISTGMRRKWDRLMFWHSQSAASPYLWYKQMESEREQMRDGRGGGRRLLSAMQRGIFTSGVFQKKKRKKKTFLSGNSYLTPARQLWQENTLGLIWFVLVVLEMLQLWETGGWWLSRVSMILVFHTAIL